MRLQQNCYPTFINVGNIDKKSSCKNHDTQNEQLFEIPIFTSQIQKKTYICFKKAENATKKDL